MRILVVDDYPPFASSLRLLLSDEHQVELALSGEQALEKLRQGAFDAVLCDVIMPGLSGLALLAEVAALQPGLERRLIFMTGGALSPELAQALEQSGSGQLQKPFDPAALRAMFDALGPA